MGAAVAWIEIVRRVAACIVLAAALAALLTPAPALIRVDPVDFADKQKREFWTGDRQLPFATYVANETKDRLVTVQGTEWQAFFQAVGETTSGRPPTSAWSSRVSQGWSSGNSVFFRPDEAPLSSVVGRLNANATFTYVVLADSTPARYLGATYQTPRWMLDTAPAGLAFPWRPLSPWLALSGVAIYVLLPRPRHPDTALFFSPLRAVLLPDLIGLVLFGMFFALPIFVIPRVSSNTSLLDPEGGWIFLTLFSWIFAVMGLAILAVATWYAVYQLLILPDRLSVTQLFGRTECPFRDMVRVDARIQAPPRGLIAFGVLVSLFNWRAIAPTLTASRPSHGIVIERREHGPLRIPLDQLQASERLSAVLKQHRVPVTADAEALLSE